MCVPCACKASKLFLLYHWGIHQPPLSGLFLTPGCCLLLVGTVQVQQQQQDWAELQQQVAPYLSKAGLGADQLQWALSVTRSRTFAAPYASNPFGAQLGWLSRQAGQQQQQHVLCPLLDLFNHSGGVQVRLKLPCLGDQAANLQLRVVRGLAAQTHESCDMTREPAWHATSRPGVESGSVFRVERQHACTQHPNRKHARQYNSTVI